MSNKLDLSGKWYVQLDSKCEGISCNYQSQDFSQFANTTINLPGSVTGQGLGTKNDKKETGFLTEEYLFEGYAWFQKKIHLDDSVDYSHVFLTLERTRISHVWIDDEYAGTMDSFCTAHIYDLSGLIKKSDFTLTIMISNVKNEYRTAGGHMTSPDTQTNWTGITGELSLEFCSNLRLSCVRTDIDYDNRKMNLRADILLFEDTNVNITSEVSVLSMSNYTDERTYSVLTCNEATSADLTEGLNIIELEYDLPEYLPVWDEYDPSVIELKVSANDSVKITHFGIRKFEHKGMHFYINGRKTFLRGTHEGLIFPLTGYAPTDLESWIRVMQKAHDFGLNHYRCHTCCPPEAAFLAADLTGIFYQPELPFWGSFYAETDPEYQDAKVSQDYLTEEGYNILDAYGNHPSFCLMTMGNELWGTPSALNKLMSEYKKYDNRHLYSQGSNNFQFTPNIQPEDDFFSGVRLSADRLLRDSYAMCDAPLGHLQTCRPSTNYSYEDAIFPQVEGNETNATDGEYIDIQFGTEAKRVKKTDSETLIPNVPIVTHEIGQYETYPDYDEIDKYTGPLKARNFEIFRQRLKDNNLLDKAKDYFHASGALAAACYKDELETALRTDDLGGFQLLDIQDYSGQGTALVGMLNSMLENKGIIKEEQWRHFCSDAVIQAEFDSYTVQNGQILNGELSITWYRNYIPEVLDVEVTLAFNNTEQREPVPASADSDDAMPDTIISKKIYHIEEAFEENGYHSLGSLEVDIPESDSALGYVLTIKVLNENIQNSYELWSYPDINDIIGMINETEIAITQTIDDAIAYAMEGTPSLVCLSDEYNPSSIKGYYASDFWCYTMFRSISESMGKEVAVGTMGLLIDNYHPALDYFPSHSYSTPQWWDIVENSRSTILDGTDINPIVQTIDNFERNHRLGLIYEVKISESDTPIVICTAPLPSLIQKGNPEAAELLYSLCDYIKNSSDIIDISTITELPASKLKALFK